MRQPLAITVAQAYQGPLGMLWVATLSPDVRSGIALLMSHKPITLRRATFDDAEFLSALAIRSKAYWPYPQDYLLKSMAVIHLHAKDIEEWPVYIAEFEGERVGFFALKIVKGDPRLDHLWIDPRYIKKGFGKILFERAVSEAKGLNWTSFRIAADPYAEEFYLKLGARRIGEIQSSVKPDLFLPLLEYLL